MGHKTEYCVEDHKVGCFSLRVISYHNPKLDLPLYIQTPFLSYGCDNFLRIYSRGERYPSALCG